MPEVLEEAAVLPLIVGRDGFPITGMPLHSQVGMLMVVGEVRERDGLFVQYCLCGCSGRECGEAADVDVRLLNDLSSLDKCVLRGRPFFPPYTDLVAAVKKKGINSTDKYRAAFARGELPRCSPQDPSQYEEWTSWADLTSDPDYHSDSELFNGLIALDLESLSLLPPPERRRVLLTCRYWTSIKQKAKGLGIEEKDIPNRLNEIVDAISDEKDVSGSGGGGGGGPRGGSKPKAVQRLSLKEQARVLVNNVTLWLPTTREVQEEIINGFYHNAWEMLDRGDSINGNGFEVVQSDVLAPLQEAKPELVTEFLRQYEGVCEHYTKGRNWMQAYSLWYAHERRRFINCSSAGLGKTRTIPAIVSTFDIQLTVLFSPKKITNEDNPQLDQEMKVEDPNAVIHFSDNGVPPFLEPGKHHYFVCNSEKLQQGPKTKLMVDAIMAHSPGLIVFDEGHLLVSSNLVDPEMGETEKDAKYKPRMEGLRYLLGMLPFDTRVIVLTGTPVRVDAREGQALFELIGEDVGEFKPEMSEMNALRLRGRLQHFGFQFLNHRLPELRRFVYPFKVPKAVALRLNGPGLSTLAKEKIRIGYALRDLYRLKGRVVINTERVALPEADATALGEDDIAAMEIVGHGEGYETALEGEDAGDDIEDDEDDDVEYDEDDDVEDDDDADDDVEDDDVASETDSTEKVALPEADATALEEDDEDDPGIDISGLSHKRFPAVRLSYEPLKRSVNPVFFTYFVDGPAEIIAAYLKEKSIKYRKCTGDSDDSELGAYLKERDSSLIASSSWSVGVDGSQRVSNALVTLAIPWHDSGHRQTIARIQRQGAVTPDGTPTTVVHEIIPVAVNVAYDVKRLNKVYSRRSFTEVLSLGEIEGKDEPDELEAAVNTLLNLPTR
jgi:hypothetical protein